ncbi:RNA polymerase sigma factor [Eisenbergiella sp.]
MNYGSSISRTAVVPEQSRAALYLLACGRLRFILYRFCRLLKKDADFSPPPAATVPPLSAERAAGILPHPQNNKAFKTNGGTEISRGLKASQASQTSQASQISQPSRSCPPLSPEEALHRYGSPILRLALSYLHNLPDAEDILQETMLRLFSSAPPFESPEHEKAWLFRVAINLSKNRLKANRRRSYDELPESLTCAMPEDLSFVWEAVSTLPVKYREIIHLYYQEEMTAAQIAALTGSKESTVRSLLFRARGMLKTQLKEAYDFEE